MSGTSGDGIDAAVVRIGPAPRSEQRPAPVGDAGIVRRAVEVLAHHHVPFDDALQRRVLAAGDARAPELALLHVELGMRFADAADAAREQAGLRPAQVAAVVTTGLTVAHIPPDAHGRPGATLALGDGDVIAERTGCLAITDLRARDRAAGGQGAPLVAYADAVLLADGERVRAALNLGGIANVTVVGPAGRIAAFDVGPGNMLLDAAVQRATRGAERFDRDGRRARAGHADAVLLGELLESDDFVRSRPPKSTGRERYGEAFWRRHGGRLARLSTDDLLATLAAFTVEAVAHALEKHVEARPDELVVSGGGALNRALMDGLAARLQPTPVRDSDAALGCPVLAREAVAMAILGDATLDGRAGNVPAVTGARRPCVLGKLSLPPIVPRAG